MSPPPLPCLPRINSAVSMQSEFKDLDINIKLFAGLRPFIASHSKDKLFAGLAMSSIQNITAVDYSLDESDVYSMFTRAWLEHTNDLNILSLCRPSGIPNFPSWAVDFSVTKEPRALGSILMFDSTYQLYSAGGKASPSF
jgi:hypothetical protein